MTIKQGKTGECPHCKAYNRFEATRNYRGFDISSQAVSSQNGYENLTMCNCTSCGKLIISLEDKVVYPLGVARSFTSEEIPTHISQDFNEACLIESLSPKASATLARRCLQNILHDQGIKKENLSKEIDEAIKSLPGYLSKAIDAIRNIGNFAAHPIKSTNSGEIIDVEEGETQRTLDVLEQLFDFYYIKPKIIRKKKEELDEKLSSAGLKPTK